MEFSLPSRRRVLRFIAVFYTVTALAFFTLYEVIGVYEPLSLFAIYNSVFWPQTMTFHWLYGVLMLLGLMAAIVEPRVAEVVN
ncbi:MULTISPECIES: hypothetical protein [Halolamina]|uniref:Uncharacterized protein n=1 Tax=Halolamina pelagica TaxID=699431 RepID=A0A1I5VK09_9EURY|nr:MULTISPECIES: hypothetical protein [Halolamina]NHX37634.1 hypothetical protein [Halolamina sp. R1-12]SFQ07761.1 hypothetical protein SAMN05216277_11841 [Halolamina pelagica]